MWGNRAWLIVCVSFVGAMCLTSCERPPVGALHFVGADQAGAGQSPAKGLVVVTHGWIEKGRGGWPEDMTRQIHKRADPNLWLCGYFDWSEGAKTVSPTEAAKYARDIAGPKLAEEIIRTKGNWRHIHLLGHSCGCWVVSEAAKILAPKTKADWHLTFFDAYVPPSWKESSLGDVNAPADVNCWAEHYYTRDLTLGWTQQDLSFAHNVDITIIDGVFRNHNFPWQWYYATIGGRYPKTGFTGKAKSVFIADGVEYGFARSRECGGSEAWEISRGLPIGNRAVRLKKAGE
ncbi:MAG TPA: hypothetical protein VMW16_13410 [Sedimentisphaerales bacterium]|nr:hypothetical protein [Sedimentisphaerales bacterium]